MIINSSLEMLAGYKQLLTAASRSVWTQQRHEGLQEFCFFGEFKDFKSLHETEAFMIFRSCFAGWWRGTGYTYMITSLYVYIRMAISMVRMNSEVHQLWLVFFASHDLHQSTDMVSIHWATVSVGYIGDRIFASLRDGTTNRTCIFAYYMLVSLCFFDVLLLGAMVDPLINPATRALWCVQVLVSCIPISRFQEWAHWFAVDVRPHLQFHWAHPQSPKVCSLTMTRYV